MTGAEFEKAYTVRHYVDLANPTWGQAVADEEANTRCNGLYPHATHDDGDDIRCTLDNRHDGEHQDHTRSPDVHCFAVDADGIEAIDWLMAVRRFGIVRANEMFPA